MDKYPALLYKGLTIGIIVLFIGVGIQPAIADNDDTTPPVTTHTLDPAEPDGNNGWYVDDVTVSLNATDDLSGVKEIRYTINGWSEHIIPGDHGSFIIRGEGQDILIEYWAIDNAGNFETINEFELDIDQTYPEVNLTYEFFGSWKWENWEWKFIANATDELSGMERVEFYFNNALQETVTGPGPIYMWICKFWAPTKIVIRATAYDKAGLSEFDEIYDPKSTSNNHMINIQQGIENINRLRISFRNWRYSYE